MKQTLLEKAKLVKTKSVLKAVNDEEVELALAYFSGVINATQAGKALGVLLTNSRSHLASILRSAVLSKMITISKV